MKGFLSSAARKIIYLLILAALLTGAYFIYARYSKKTEDSSVETIQYVVTRGSIRLEVSAAGTTNAAHTYTITAPYGGRVADVKYSEGQEVKKGDILFTLDNDGAQLELERAELALTQLRKQLSSHQSQRSRLAIYAPAKGIVRAVNVMAGDSINTQYNRGENAPVVIEDISLMKFGISMAGETALMNSLKAGDELPLSVSGIEEERRAQILSSESTSEGNHIIFRVNETKGLEWGSYYNAALKLPDGTVIEERVKFSGDLFYAVPRENGEVSGVHVKEGDMVKKGQKVADMRSGQLENQIQNAEVSVASARIDAGKRREAVDALEVKVPADGIVVSMHAGIGDAAGAGPMAVIEDRSSIQAWIYVDELDIGKMETGQEARVTVDAFKGRVYTGRVSSIAPKGTVKNGTSVFKVVVDIENSSELKTGMTANVSILTASKQDTLLLPVEAVQYDGRGQSFVLVNEGGRIQPKDITMGIADASHVEILNGLKEGETVIVQYHDSKNSKPGILGIEGF